MCIYVYRILSKSYFYLSAYFILFYYVYLFFLEGEILLAFLGFEQFLFSFEIKRRRGSTVSNKVDLTPYSLADRET